MSSTSTKGVARRPHTKARTGCGTCKRRKIKCDEHKPQCHNCTRHSVACTFSNGHGEKVLSSSQNSPITINNPSPMSPQRQQTPTPHDSNASVDPTLMINSVYLNLLHHYTTVTSYTLSADPLLRTLWRVEVPQLAFSSNFLMRSIFALAANHLARLSHEKEEFYLKIARREHQIALLEASPLLCSITTENCSALYAFSILTFIYKWASPRSAEDIPLLSETGTADWLVLFRGIRSIGEVATEGILNGPLGSMMRLGAQRVEHIAAPLRSSAWWMTTIEHAQLEQLRRNLATTISDPDILQIYRKGIDDLEICFCGINLTTNELRLDQDSTLQPTSPSVTRQRLPDSSSVYSWLYRASDKYLELLSKSHQEALVIFAHFCIVLKALEGCWWMHGWCEYILQAVFDLLEPDYKLWIQWPMEEIGWARR